MRYVLPNEYLKDVSMFHICCEGLAELHQCLKGVPTFHRRSEGIHMLYEHPKDAVMC